MPLPLIFCVLLFLLVCHITYNIIINKYIINCNYRCILGVYVRLCVRVFVRLCVRVFVCMCMCVCVCMCMCVYIH